MARTQRLPKLDEYDQFAQDSDFTLQSVDGRWFWNPSENWSRDYTGSDGSTTKAEAVEAFKQYQREMI